MNAEFWQYAVAISILILLVVIHWYIRTAKKNADYFTKPEKSETKVITRNTDSEIPPVFKYLPFMGTNPEYHPVKHPICTYGRQRRRAKQYKKYLAKHPK